MLKESKSGRDGVVVKTSSALSEPVDLAAGTDMKSPDCLSQLSAPLITSLALCEELAKPSLSDVKKSSMGSYAKKVLVRYGPPEIAGTLTAFIGAYVTLGSSGSPAVTAVVGALSENVGYYGLIFLKDYTKKLQGFEGRSFSKKYLLSAVTTSASMFGEFGAAEVVDSGFSRPALMYLGQKTTSLLGAGFLGQLGGFVVGKLAADVVFYSIVVPNKALLDNLKNRFLSKTKSNLPS